MSEGTMQGLAGHRGSRGRAARASVLTVLLVAAATAMTLALWPSAGARAQEADEPPVRQGLFAVAGQISPNTYGLYLVDEAHGGLAVYEYVPSDRKLYLRAARAFRYDLELEAYNTEPAPREVADMVNQARRIPETSPAAP